MSNIFNEILTTHGATARELFRRIVELNRPFLLQSDIWDVFQSCAQSESGGASGHTDLAWLFRRSQEAIVQQPMVYLAVRADVAVWNYLCIDVKQIKCQEVGVSEFLSFKERVKGHVGESWDGGILEVDLSPFSRGFPRLQEVRSIGRGVEFLNRHLSSLMFADLKVAAQRLLHFLGVHQSKGQQLMLNGHIATVDEMMRALRNGEKFLGGLPKDTPWKELREQMREMGFEPGWGNTAGRVLEGFNLVTDILEAPDSRNMERFLERIPMIFDIVILSPHGYFGQENVMGLPDTGGQVIYILDQVRALEAEMRRRVFEHGIDIAPQIVVVTRLIPDAGETTCSQPLEKIAGTENARIIRIPFRDPNGNVIPHWISRFRIWPHLERFAIEAERAILTDLGDRPDLIIGNYSDGNLVASLLAQRLGVTQCNIAHALEKAKHLFSAMYWKEMEENYHFSCQFTADLIAMNTADFIITSTYQEIAGTEEEVGQYESYKSFTMPGLFRVIDGVDVFDPKFNIVSPGADAEVYFPYSQKNRRLPKALSDIQRLISDAHLPNTRGGFDNADKPIIFTIARLDKIKNLQGLVEWFGRSDRLRERANLLMVTSVLNPDYSKDDEERGLLHRVHELMDQYGLERQMRWIGMRSERKLTGELYRYIADRRGVFVQPALFEAFGLTIVEAMASGLPTFATRYGGPLEIIVHGESGFHIDPNRGDEAAGMIADFFDRCKENDGHWNEISRAGIRRIEERYTWQLYAKRLMSQSCIYSFWKYISNLERQETKRYLEMFYWLMFKRRSEMVG